MPRGVNDYDTAKLQGRNVSNADSFSIVSPGIVTDGLALHLDAGNRVSYPTSGTAWYDLSVYRNNGTLTNGPTFNLENGGSIVFDGTNDYVTLPRPSLIATGGSLSIDMWAKWTTTGTTTSTIQTLIDNNHQVSPNRGFYIQDRPDLSKVLTFSINPAAGEVASTIIVGDGTWRHICCTGDTASMRIYINGSLNNSASISSTGIATVQTDVTISAWQQGGFPTRYVNGNVARTLLYNRVLTATEVAQNFNATRARFGI